MSELTRQEEYNWLLLLHQFLPGSVVFQEAANNSYSTTVAEYFAMYEATTETVCLCNLLNDLQIPQKCSTLLHKDNQSTIKLAEDEASHKRTKHINAKYKYTRKQQDIDTICVKYVPSEENLADFFTKLLARIQFQEICKHLSLHH